MLEKIAVLKEKLVEIEHLILRSLHIEARAVMNTMPEHLSDLHAKLTEGANALRNADAKVAEQVTEREKSLDESLREAAMKVHEGGLELAQAAAQVANKLGVEMHAAMSRIGAMVEHMKRMVLEENQAQVSELTGGTDFEKSASVSGLTGATRITDVVDDAQRRSTGDQQPSAPQEDPTIERAARAAHEANRQYCESLGDNSLVPWEGSSEEQKETVRNGVRYLIDNPTVTPEEQHANWMGEKIANGWVYGEVKDAEKKTHPCLVTYDKLPPEQQKKDLIFRETVIGVLSPESQHG